jgi:SHS2 domain-containing protein
MGRYEFFDHIADVGIRIQANSPQDLFVTAALALMAWIGPPPDGETVVERVSAEAEDLNELFVRWLQEIHCRFHLQHAYVTGVQEISVDFEQGDVEALVCSKTWDESMNKSYQEVKAITYHQLRIEQQGSIWLASVILDI